MFDQGLTIHKGSSRITHLRNHARVEIICLVTVRSAMHYIALAVQTVFLFCSTLLAPGQNGSAQLVTPHGNPRDRKSTRLNSSQSQSSYAVFCLKKKRKNHQEEKQKEKKEHEKNKSTER